MDQPAGPLVDGLGIQIDLAEDDLLVDAVILSKVVAPDGAVSLSVSSSPTLSWLDQLGLVTAASDLIRSSSYERPDDD